MKAGYARCELFRRGTRTLFQDLDRRCLSNDDISNSIRAIAAINLPSTTGGSLFGLVVAN
jgi:hypothetical protein